MNDKNFLDSLRRKLRREGLLVTEIEMTSGNYDDDGNFIKEQVPTLTTDFCEIGVISGKTCYFTVILYSDLCPKSLFDSIKDYKEIHIYGFKSFLEDYYPKKGFSFSKLVEEIKSEPYFQIQFNFNIQRSDFETIFQEYMKLKEIFAGSRVKIVNQMTHDFC